MQPLHALRCPLRAPDIDCCLMVQLGYLATTLFLNEDSEYIIMLVNTIMKDLRDDNPLVGEYLLSALPLATRNLNFGALLGFSCCCAI